MQQLNHKKNRGAINFFDLLALCIFIEILHMISKVLQKNLCRKFLPYHTPHTLC